MDKLSALRRNLLLRLIVFECEMAGYLELLETLLIGKATVADYKKLFGQLDLNQDKLTALHNAAIDVAKQLKGSLEIQKVDFLPILHSDTSLPSSFEYKIEEFESVVQHLKARACSSNGEIEIPFLMRGILTKDPPRRYCAGREFFQLDLLGLSKVDPVVPAHVSFFDNFSHIIGFSRVDDSVPLTTLFQIKDSCIAINQIDAGTSCYSILNIIEKSTGLINVLDTYREIFAFQVYDECEAVVSQNRNLLNKQGFLGYDSVVATINVSKSPYPTARSEGKILLADLQLRGYIEIGSERAVFGTFWIPGVFGTVRPTYKTEENGLMPLVKIYPQGTAITLGLPRLQNGIRASALWDQVLEYKGYADVGTGLFGEKGLLLRQERFLAKMTKRIKDQLFSIQRYYQFNIFSTISKPSYWDMMSAFGVLELDNVLNAVHSCGLHKTMEYRFVPDLENGGDTLEIDTNYHKEAEGITYLGWRYFGYIIE